MNSIYLIKSCDRQSGDRVSGNFFETLDEAKSEIDRMYRLSSGQKPKWIERLNGDVNYGGFQVITEWGHWRSYSIVRVDRANGRSEDLENELIEGHEAKFRGL